MERPLNSSKNCGPKLEHGIAVAIAAFLREALGDDEPSLLGAAGLVEPHGSRLLDAVDVGLRQRIAHRAVEVAEAGDDDDGRRHAIGDLDQVAGSLLEAILRVVEEAQVLDLIDGEDERRAVDGPHQPSERFDDLEGAPLAGIGVERSHGLGGKVGELAAVKVLAHALVDARVGALQVEERAHDIDIEAVAGELGRGDDVVGERQHHLGELGVVELGVAQLLERGRIEHILVGDKPAREAGKSALATLVGVVGLFQRVDEAAQVVVGVVGDVGRHLRVAEVGLAGAMGRSAQGADEVGLAGARLAVEQQDARLHARAAALRRHGVQELGELAARRRMDRLDVDRVGAPEVVLPGDGVLEGRGQPVRLRRDVGLEAH